LYQALEITGLGIVTIYGTQVLLSQLPLLDLVTSIGGDVAAAVVVVWAARRLGYGLGVRGAPARFWAAGLLVGLSTWYIALVIVSLVRPPGDEHALQKIVNEGPVLPSLVALALLPAIAEELVFRGALARGLAARFGGPVAVIASALVFSAYHLIPSQMLGVLPLGLALGVLAVRSKSVLPGMIAHATNNAIALLLSRNEIPTVTDAIAAHPFTTLGTAIVLLVTAFGLAAKAAA
jgi:membrane protease YdiL (CAAX protease family)